jgi:uncharacterized glyoxalase superfamily protein PhnB
MKKRDGDPWMPAGAYSKSLNGFGVNLLVQDVPAAVAFAQDVLLAEAVYSDPDFAVLRARGAEWILHADHTYDNHPLHGSLGAGAHRGVGVELRLHNMDPDAAEARARARGDTVFAGALDKGHGLREANIIDPDGYLWVVDCPTKD